MLILLVLMENLVQIMVNILYMELYQILQMSKKNIQI